MAEQSPSENPRQEPAQGSGHDSVAGDEVGWLDMLIVLAKHKRLVLGVPFLVAVIAAVVSLLMTNIYTGTVKILPPQQSASAAAAILSQLSGALGALSSPGGGGGAIKSPNEIYIGMLKSRTVADSLIARFGLQQVYEQKYMSLTRKVLEGNTNIVTLKEGIIQIEFDDKDPKRAADVANAYIDELMKLTKVLAVTEASQRRLFFEHQLTQAKDNLAAAEIAARQSLEKGGLTQVDAQGYSMIDVTARLRAQISAKEVQLGSMRTFASEQNPEMQRVQHELESTRRELSRIEGSSPVAATPAKGQQASNSGLDSLGRLRNVKYYGFLYEMLARQFELAKIDEARDTTVVQVLDRAIEPDRKSKPRRSLIVVISGLVAFVGSSRVDLQACKLEYSIVSPK